MNTRYLALMLIAFLPSLSGCLQDFHLKADVEGRTGIPEDAQPPESPKGDEGEQADSGSGSIL